MADKDHYVVLGISRSESPGGVRKAFRDLARQHHPDMAGPGGAPMFRDVVQAYRVLSDPERRREYDASLGQHEAHRAGRRVPRARRVQSRRAFDALDLFDNPSEIRSSSEALLDRLLRNFLGRGIAKAERREPLLCDILLEEDEARIGGVLPIRIPVVAPCATCHGAGHVAGYPCRACDALGESRDEVVVPLEVPPGVRPGTVLEIPLDRWGVHNLWLRARIGVRR